MTNIWKLPKDQKQILFRGYDLGTVVVTNLGEGGLRVDTYQYTNGQTPEGGVEAPLIGEVEPGASQAFRGKHIELNNEVADAKDLFGEFQVAG